jgi:hypothetical protein
LENSPIGCGVGNWQCTEAIHATTLHLCSPPRRPVSEGLKFLWPMLPTLQRQQALQKLGKLLWRHAQLPSAKKEVTHEGC